mmetsp:Transcript_33112/g.67596  ORF Transcript_33112/g.67596 Transcript_33112/m.67596 type:complete len:86 (-) Transcript_33112:153-410(-)
MTMSEDTAGTGLKVLGIANFLAEDHFGMARIQLSTPHQGRSLAGKSQNQDMPCFANLTSTEHEDGAQHLQARKIRHEEIHTDISD